MWRHDCSSSPVHLDHRFKLIFLGLLLIPLTALVYTRGIGLRLGAAPTQLSAPFTTEEAWIVDEIVRDIAEMSAYPGRAEQSGPTVSSTTDFGLYSVALAPRDQPMVLDLRADLWAPFEFEKIAQAGARRSSPRVRAGSIWRPVYPALVEFTPAALVTVSQQVSQRLSDDMRDERAHES